MILAISIAKGGTGKSTLTVNLAAIWGQKQPCLVVDADPQGSASYMLGTDPSPPGLPDVLTKTLSIKSAIRETTHKGVFLLAGGSRLKIQIAIDTQQHLRQELLQFPGEVLIDCPPSANPLTDTVLAVADAIIVPVTARFADIIGAAESIRNMEPRVLAVVPQMTDRRVRATDQILQSIRTNIGKLVTKTEIPISSKAAEAAAHGIPLALYDKRSRAAIDYQNLARELASRITSRRRESNA